MENRAEIPERSRAFLSRVGEDAAARQLDAYAVGGCVRDWLLGRDATDLDIAVEGDAAGFARAFAASVGGKAVEYPAFRTASVTGGGAPGRVDFVACRRERYVAPAAYPQVSPGTLEEDLFRRDFTINAMAVCLRPGRFGVLADPFGGRADLESGMLRVLHRRSFEDDPSRILRGIRFLERFDLAWEPATERLARCALRGGALQRLNAGRIEKEFGLMTSEPAPARCFHRLEALLAECASP